MSLRSDDMIVDISIQRVANLDVAGKDSVWIN